MTQTLPLSALHDGVAIVGKTGSGKSYTARGIVERIAPTSRIAIIDPTGVWWGLRVAADGHSDGLRVVVLGGMQADVQITENDGEAVGRTIGEGAASAVIDLSEFTGGARRRFMTKFLESLYHHNRAPLHLVVDEADEFAPQRPMPDQTVMFSHLDRIVRRGRVRGFRPMLITQRPAVLHKDVLSQMGTLIALKLVASQDRAAIKAWIDGQADRERGKAIIASLPGLKVGNGWVWAPSLDILERFTFPKIDTYDSMQTPSSGSGAAYPSLPPVDASAFARILQESKRPEQNHETRYADPDVDVHAISAEAYARGFDDATQKYQRIIERIMVSVVPTLEAANKSISDAIKSAMDVAQIETDRTGPAPTIRHEPEARSTVVASGNRESMPKANRLILTALAQYPNGRTKTQVAVLTGYSGGGGSFNNALSALRTAGHISGSNGGSLQITPTGLRALGSFTPLPRRLELLNYWVSRLGKAEREVLSTLHKCYPKTMTKEQVGAATGYEHKGGSFNNALSKLRTLELIEGRSELRASAAFFQ